MVEHGNLRLEGEDEPQGEIPTRILTNFVIVEEDRKRMRSIDPQKNYPLEAIGYATPAIEADEDAGQEDEGHEEDEQPSGLRIRTTLILRISCDYMQTTNLYAMPLILLSAF